MNTLLLRSPYMPRAGSLASFTEWQQTEQQNTSSVSREGELLEYETLELRVHPPNICIDNKADDTSTVITVDSANRPGTLVEVSGFSGVFVCRRR